MIFFRIDDASVPSCGETKAFEANENKLNVLKGA